MLQAVKRRAHGSPNGGLQGPGSTVGGVVVGRGRGGTARSALLCFDAKAGVGRRATDLGSEARSDTW